MPDDLGIAPGFPRPLLVIGALIALTVITVIVATIVRGTVQWSRNNASPVVTAMTRVVAKRADVHGGRGDSRARTAYFSTFELPTGERVELPLSAREFGLIADGDVGQLSYQGNRFKAFQRTGIASR